MTDFVTKRASVWFWYEMVTGGPKFWKMGKTPTAAVPDKKHTRKNFKVEGNSIKPAKKHTRKIFKLEGK
jgi:hypothetical protein